MRTCSLGAMLTTFIRSGTERGNGCSLRENGNFIPLKTSLPPDTLSGTSSSAPESQDTLSSDNTMNLPRLRFFPEMTSC